MSVAGGWHARPREQTRAWPHYIYANLAWGVATILRPPGGKAIPILPFWPMQSRRVEQS